jgi:N-acetylglucosamine-6-sulfatase
LPKPRDGRGRGRAPNQLVRPTENTMRNHAHALAAIAALCVVFGVTASADAAPAGKSCQQIRKACEQAGFSQTGAKGGTGLMTDCVTPIMQGLQAASGGKSLPAIDPKILAACQSENPTFGQIKRGGAQTAGANVKGQAKVVATAPEPPQVSTPLPGGLTKPNIVFVLTDDLAMNLLKYLPNVQAMQKEGTTFANYFVTDSLCCPSRSSIFTGKFPHDTGVFTNEPPDGGYQGFNTQGNEAQTFAVALQLDGYQTAMLGKYLNGYDPKKNAPPQGWNEWDVAGNGYPEFNYDLNQNGKVVHHAKDPTDYLTDVLAGIADGFIRKSASGPFFIEIATFAPHAPYTPAPRDADKFPGLTVPQTAAYAARPDADAPRWLKDIPPLNKKEMDKIDQDFRMRAQSVQAVDKMIGELRATLVSLGIADKTYIVFSSDNGYHMGDYSLRPGKMTPFDTDINVPLVVVGPGVAKGQVLKEIVENIDLCPTFTDLGSGQGPTKVDGHSLVPLLLGASGAEWRQSALIEHHRPNNFDMADPDAPIPNSSNPITYEALRTAKSLYVEYEDGETGLYDLTHDPYELKNIAGISSESDIQKFRSALAANKDCHGAAACWEAQNIAP